MCLSTHPAYANHVQNGSLPCHEAYADHVWDRYLFTGLRHPVEQYDEHVHAMYRHGDENPSWFWYTGIMRPRSGPYARIDYEEEDRIRHQRMRRECPVGDPLLGYLDDY